MCTHVEYFNFIGFIFQFNFRPDVQLSAKIINSLGEKKILRLDE